MPAYPQNNGIYTFNSSFDHNMSLLFLCRVRKGLVLAEMEYEWAFRFQLQVLLNEIQSIEASTQQAPWIPRPTCINTGL